MSRVRFLFGLLILITAASGCARLSQVSAGVLASAQPAVKLVSVDRDKPQLKPRTLQTLRRHDLHVDTPEEIAHTLKRLREIAEEEPSAEISFAIADLAYWGGVNVQEKDHKAALDLYGAAIVQTSECLFNREQGPASPFDPRFRQSCELYNDALENSLRILRDHQGLVPGRRYKIETATRQIDVEVAWRSSKWRNDEFSRFEFVSDYVATGLINSHRTFGLGVPLIAVRQAQPDPTGIERHYPPNLGVSATAILRLAPQPASEGDGADQKVDAVLEIYDPLESSAVEFAQTVVPLEADYSTPLAWLLQQAEPHRLKLQGLLKPEESQSLRGMYLLEPFDPDKIPVVMVHGLASTPGTWIDMFNDLRTSEAIRQNFQFWFYLYPTGQPFWNTAAQMREDLADIRDKVDARRRYPKLNQMVLIGHSMGGLVSKLQTLDSGDDYWRIVSDKPFQMVSAGRDTRQRLQKTFFFDQNKAIKRIITIGTPHRGSRFANGFTRWLGAKLIELPEAALQGRNEFAEANPGLIRDPRLLSISTSIDSLAPESPIFPVMSRTRVGPVVKHHNIVGVVEDPQIWQTFSGEGDGVVTFASAHLENVDSELVVDADHVSVHRHPLAIREVRRILLDHLRETRRVPVFDPSLAAQPRDLE